VLLLFLLVLTGPRTGTKTTVFQWLLGGWFHHSIHFCWLPFHLLSIRLPMIWSSDDWLITTCCYDGGTGILLFNFHLFSIPFDSIVPDVHSIRLIRLWPYYVLFGRWWYQWWTGGLPIYLMLFIRPLPFWHSIFCSSEGLFYDTIPAIPNSPLTVMEDFILTDRTVAIPFGGGEFLTCYITMEIHFWSSLQTGIGETLLLEGGYVGYILVTIVVIFRSD